jgi:hypothetical protein
MPTTTPNLMDALRRLAIATLAYAVALAVVAGCMLPTLLSTRPVAALLPKPTPVVARSPTLVSIGAAPILKGPL